MERKVKVLCVDDEQQSLKALKRLLSLREDAEVVAANSGSKALAYLKRDPGVALIISDYRMPELTGVDLFEQSRQIAPDAMRIMLTAYADADIALDAINRGEAFRFLTKPCDADALTQVVQEAMEVFRLKSLPILPLMADPFRPDPGPASGTKTETTRKQKKPQAPHSPTRPRPNRFGKILGLRLLMGGWKPALVLLLFSCLCLRYSTSPFSAREFAGYDGYRASVLFGDEVRGPFFFIRPFTVNLVDGETLWQLRLMLNLKLANHCTAREIERVVPRLRNDLVIFMANRQIDRVDSPEGERVLREQLLSQLNGLLGNGKVKSLAFTHFSMRPVRGHEVLSPSEILSPPLPRPMGDPLRAKLP